MLAWRVVLSAIDFNDESWIPSFKRRVISSIYFFPVGPLSIINKFRFQCTIFSYASLKSFSFFFFFKPPFPLELWLSLLSLAAVLELMLFSLFLFLQKLRSCSNPLLVLNLRWHMLQLTYCLLFWFWFCWFEVINSLGLSSMTTSYLNTVFLL